MVSRVSWGAVTLAWLYRQLGMASRAGTTMIGGYLILLQVWIYEYFTQFRPHAPLPAPSPGAPRVLCWSSRFEHSTPACLQAYRLAMDEMSPQQIVWQPFGPDPARTCSRTTYVGLIRAFDVHELYMADRALRQLGRVQLQPTPPIFPVKASCGAVGAYKIVHKDSDVESSWLSIPRSRRTFIDVPHPGYPWETVAYYGTWFTLRSHVQMVNGPNQSQEPVADPTAAQYWMNEFAHSCYLCISTSPRGKPLEEDIVDDIDELFQRWSKVMQFDLPRGSRLGGAS